MSYNVYLQDNNGGPLTVPKHTEGGTYTVGGTIEAELNVTYNYAQWFIQAGLLESLRSLDKKKGKDAISMLSAAVAFLGVKRDSDYWKATAGNAGHALNILLDWCRIHPDGIFKVN